METTTSNYQKETKLFPNSDDFSKLKFYNLMLELEKFARPSLQFQYFLSIFGIVLTILHLVILTRKGMMMSSIIAIMIGIGICDLIAMIATIQSVDFFFDEEGTDCCSNVPSNTQYTIHTQKRSYLFTMSNEVFGKSYMLINGIISKIIPCILLPLLTFLLVLELRRAEIIRKTSNFTKRSENNGTEKTTGLVIFMTVSFFVLELPIGISWCFQVAYTDLGFLYLATYLNHLCNSIFIINATFHGIVCFMMSSQYRATVWKILRLNKDQPATSNSTQLSRVENI
ncbi:Protein CBR-SRW-98 [Caenorhabditis briggsae]|uniref:Protein CBR-SRW-98 n=1 Tax=Caenorhabditis briggsae TaxID=6238 RepID=A8X2E5_CAEBR|nr:Protein CBR-SRW-98 [Caenorhabditis briggsae]CAP26805.2 Protein CBR-SRW-98 [Caenorhabditis briggsae]